MLRPAQTRFAAARRHASTQPRAYMRWQTTVAERVGRAAGPGAVFNSHAADLSCTGSPSRTTSTPHVATRNCRAVFKIINTPTRVL